MASPKLLIGGVVTVGSVSTAAVVAHQQGFFSLPGSQTQSSDNTANTGTPNNSGSESTISQPASGSETPPAKPNQKAIEDWLTTNKGESEGWKIQIKKNNQPQDFKNELITEDDLKDLKEYLSAGEREELLKSLFSNLESKTLIFDKSSGSWKHILTKADIEKWVEKTSQKKATLKVVEGETEKGNFNEDESIAIFKAVYGKKDMFTNPNGGDVNNKKTILFEKVGDDWKHSKTEITNWLGDSKKGNNKFTVQIKDSTTLENANEGDLIGLFNYLTTSKETLFKFTKDPTPITLTFKKESSGWDVVHNKTTVDNWVSSTTKTQTTLQFYEGTQTKEPTGDEWKTFFNSIKDDTTLFSDSTKTKIVFEKVDGGWKHIKKALTDLLTTTKKKTGLTIKISKDGTTTTDLSNAKDEDLVGLYKFIHDSSDLDATDGVSFLVFKKDNDSWSRDKTQEKNQ